MSSTTTLFVVCLGVFGVASAQYYGGHGLGILPGYSGSLYSGYRGAGSNVHFPTASPYGAYGGGYGSYGGYGANNGASRYGTGYIGNGGIGIRSSGATLANLYNLPPELAQAPAPRSLPAPLPPQQAYGAIQSPYGPIAPTMNPYYGQAAGMGMRLPSWAGAGPGLLNGAHLGGASGYLG